MICAAEDLVSLTWTKEICALALSSHFYGIIIIGIELGFVHGKQASDNKLQQSLTPQIIKQATPELQDRQLSHAVACSCHMHSIILLSAEGAERRYGSPSHNTSSWRLQWHIQQTTSSECSKIMATITRQPFLSHINHECSWMWQTDARPMASSLALPRFDCTWSLMFPLSWLVMGRRWSLSPIDPPAWIHQFCSKNRAKPIIPADSSGSCFTL